MKNKRTYFLIESIIQIVLSITAILGAEASRQSILDSISLFPEEIRDRMISIYSSNSIFIVPNVLCIIFSIIILYIIFKDILGSKKKLVLGLSIATLVLATNSIVSILAIVNIIIAAKIRNNDVRNEKKEIPSLDRIDTDFKSVFGGCLCLAIYFSQFFLRSTGNYVLNLIITICFYLIVLIACLFFFRINLKRDIVLFKNNCSAYISYIVPRLGVMYIVYILVSFICIYVFNHAVSVNQQAVESLPLWYSIPLAIVWAPIVEEILFRGCIRRFIKNDIVFIIVSGIIFGLLHTISEGSLISALVMMLPYAVLGSGFAYFYVKTNNITNNILCHFFHNSIGMLMQIMFL